MPSTQHRCCWLWGQERQVLEIVRGEGRHWAMSSASDLDGPVWFLFYWLIINSWRNSRNVEKTKSPQLREHKATISVPYSFLFSWVSHMQIFAQEVFGGKLRTCESEVGDWPNSFCQPSRAGEGICQSGHGNMRLWFFSPGLNLFVWLEGAFVKLKPWCIQEISKEHMTWGCGLEVNL